MEFKNLYGINVKSFERALLEGRDPDTDSPWYVITDEVGRLIVGGYKLGLNPLSHLREIFPSFTWEFHEVDALSPTWLIEVKELIAQTDYIWPAAYGTEECFVTARRKNSRDEPWKLLGDSKTPCEVFDKEQVGRNNHPLMAV